MKVRAQLNGPCIYTTRECTQRFLPTNYNIIISGIQSPLNPHSIPTQSPLNLHSIPTHINLNCKSRVSRRSCFFDRQLCVQKLALKNPMRIQTLIKRITVVKSVFMRAPSRIICVIDFHILLMNFQLFTPLFTTFKLNNVSIEWFYSVTPGYQLQ